MLPYEQAWRASPDVATLSAMFLYERLAAAGALPPPPPPAAIAGR